MNLFNMKRKNRISEKSGSSKSRNEKSRKGKDGKHPFQKFLKDKPDRETSRRDKSAFSKPRPEHGREKSSGFSKKETRTDRDTGRNSGHSKGNYRARKASPGRDEGDRSSSRQSSEYEKKHHRTSHREEPKEFKPFDRESRGTGERERKGGRSRSSFSKKGDRDKHSKSDKSFRPEQRERRETYDEKKSDRRFSRSGDFNDKFKKDQKETPEKRFKHDDFAEGRGFKKREETKSHDKRKQTSSGPGDGLMRLNKYLAHAGIASRRDADDLIISGAVKVNGIVVTQLGAKIKPGDKVTYGDQSVQGERKVYLLLNKPKDYITTMDDPRDRKTVMHLVEGACRERVYPVGRLDRNTTGLLLLTNDGELAAKLTHPKYGVKKVYHASINKGLKPEHFRQLTEGIELEDGMVKVDDIAFVGEGKKEIGLELHSGKNRVVRRLFEHLGYDVVKLDRVVFAGLTKKDLPRGKYRFLSPKEVSFLKMIG